MQNLPECAFSIRKKNISNNFLEIVIFSEKYQYINIRVADQIKNTKLNSWEELGEGKNFIVMDLSSLNRGIYQATVTMNEGEIFTEDFTIF